MKADDDRTPQTDCEGRIFLGACPDGWLAERLVQKCEGRVRCVDHTRTFLEWDGNSWRDDVVSTVPLTLLARMNGLGIRWDQILKEARSDARVAVSFDKLDQDPDLLGTPAGVIDLRTGDLLRPDPTMCVTRTTAVASSRGAAPKWQSFLDEATDGDGDMQSYLQRVAGYWLTGHTCEHALFYLWGPTSGGKSVFLKIVETALGDYAHVAGRGIFAPKRLSRSLADLAGSRIVLMPEVREGRYWGGQPPETLSGGDAVVARFRFHNSFLYKPTFKLVFKGNRKPRIAFNDEATKWRNHRVPFARVLKTKALDLAVQLIRAELPEILAWMVDGAVAWHNGGLQPPQCVIAGTPNYWWDPDKQCFAKDDVVRRSTSLPAASCPGGCPSGAQTERKAA